ncbi:UNVERIFIED_CONTAM: thiamine phosphate synthase [Halobacillus marinus]|uniref:thiamine phosphate synthase n=1 Tax=Bacillaceae TaxID=186817 RepID=UPI0002A516DE|nr:MULTISPECIES: thiamine phosphate synthase [Bacillaceae]ELK46334.1 thiamine-phosphate synthase [Halobacillus sp. BAB-2008]QHT48363.1 thiamine phosphate synthase [Bacillus sp. SB49]
MTLSHRLRKYLVMGSQDCVKDPLETLSEAVSGGITAFQFREKGDGSMEWEDKVELGRALKRVCDANNVLFVVNDDIRLFEVLEAEAIHVGQEDAQVESIRAAYPDAVIGLSLSDRNHLEQSPLHLVDYVGAGPIFPTSTKRDANPVTGPEFIRDIRMTHPELPVVGIGGIDEHNAHLVMEAGAAGVAVVSAVTKAADIERAVQSL